MSWIESYYNFMKVPYYELEFYIDENRRIGTEYHKVNGQTIIKSKKFPDKAFYIPKSYNPDIIGYKRRVKFFVENTFPRVDPGTYAPAEDYEILIEGIKNEKGETQYLVARSDFFRKVVETKFVDEIIAEPPDKWAWLQPILILVVVIIGIYVLFTTLRGGL